MRLLRGRVAIREDIRADTDHYRHIVVPEVWDEFNPKAGQEARTWHRGTVVAMGPPALTRKRRVEIPPGFKVGDQVLFHWGHHEECWTWVHDGDRLAFVPQQFVDAVIEDDSAQVIEAHSRIGGWS